MRTKKKGSLERAMQLKSPLRSDDDDYDGKTGLMGDDLREVEDNDFASTTNDSNSPNQIYVWGCKTCAFYTFFR